jgi:amicyanin
MKLTLFLAALMTLMINATAYAKEVKVTIKDHAFTPSKLTINKGDKVTWTNFDQDPHNVIDEANPKTFHSPALDTKDTYSFTFTVAGKYDYFCTFHPTMIGKVVVR